MLAVSEELNMACFKHPRKFKVISQILLPFARFSYLVCRLRIYYLHLWLGELKFGGTTPASKVATSENSSSNSLANSVEELQISDRTCTGVLCSHPLSRDMRIESLSLTFHDNDLIVDSDLELNCGRRYGLLGLNGCGKSTLLSSIGHRELPIHEYMDIYQLSREIEACDMTSLEAVISCDEERLKLEKEVEMLSAQDDGGGEALEHIYEKLDALDAATAEKRAAEILFGLGFNKQRRRVTSLGARG